jgi:hypothetical protein
MSLFVRDGQLDVDHAMVFARGQRNSLARLLQ